MTFTAKWFESKGMFRHYFEARCGNGRCACTTLVVRAPERPALAFGRGIHRTDDASPTRADQGAVRKLSLTDLEAMSTVAAPAAARIPEWRFADRVVREWKDWALRGGSWRAFFERLVVEPAGEQHIAHDRSHLGNLAVVLPAVVRCPVCEADNLIPLTEAM